MEEFSLCRTCLNQNSLNPIFDDEKDHSQYSEVIFATTGLKIELNDGLPQKMCPKCLAFVNEMIAFRKKCKESESTLLHLQRQLGRKKNSIKISKKRKKNKIDITKEDEIPLVAKTVEFHNSPDPLTKDKNIQHNETFNNHNDEPNPEEGKDEINEFPFEEDIFTPIIEYNSDSDEKDEKSETETKELKLYEVVDADKKRVLCKLCQKEMTKRSIYAHMSRCHPGIDENRLKCEFCETYVSKAKMKRHIVQMHGSGTFKCGYCKSEHGSRESLIEHAATCAAKKKKRKPSEAGRELKECDVCHKTMQKASLRMHKAVKHAGLGPVCEHCGQRFANKFRLDEHYRAKHGYEKFKCTYCKFESAGVMAMRNHERRHRGEKPFVCEACGAKFHAAYLLAQHRHSHRIEKLVTCDLCPATFKANNSLHTHKMTCHNTAMYRCGVCDRAYRCRHYVVKHQRQVHQYDGVPLVTKELGGGPVVSGE